MFNVRICSKTFIGIHKRRIYLNKEKKANKKGNKPYY